MRLFLTINVKSATETYFELAKLYRGIDNLSKELEALDTYQNNYSTGNDISAVKSRLFEIYVETENWDKAKETWPVQCCRGRRGFWCRPRFGRPHRAILETVRAGFPGR